MSIEQTKPGDGSPRTTSIYDDLMNLLHDIGTAKAHSPMPPYGVDVIDRKMIEASLTRIAHRLNEAEYARILLLQKGYGSVWMTLDEIVQLVPEQLVRGKESPDRRTP